MSFEILAMPKVIFANSPAEVTIKKQNILTVLGVYAKANIVILAANSPNDGEYLDLRKAGKTFVLFQFSDLESDDCNTLPAYGVLYTDFEIYIRELAKLIGRHPLINREYDVKFISVDINIGAIAIEARNPGTLYSLAVDTTDNTPAVVLNSATEFINGVDSEVPLNHKFNGEIKIVNDWFYNPKTTVVPNIELTGDLSADNNSISAKLYELPSIAKHHLGFDIPFDAFRPLQARKAVAEIYLNIFEQSLSDLSDDPLVPFPAIYSRSKRTEYSDMVPGNQLMIINGGYALNKQPASYSSDLNSPDRFDNFMQWLTNGSERRFLSQNPDRKKLVTKQSPEWLSLLVPGITTVAISARFLIYYANGSVSAKAVNIPDELIYNQGVIIIPTGWDQNDLGSVNTLQTPLKYTVYVWAGGGAFTETFTYILDTRIFETERYFLYRNSLGFADTMRCVGVSDYSVKRKGDTAEMAITAESDGSRGSIEMIYNEREEVFTMRTGWLLTQAEKDALTDMLFSTYVAEIVVPLLMPASVNIPDDSEYLVTYKQVYRSVIILDDSIQMFTSKDNTYALEWKMKYAHNDINYSNFAALKQPSFESFFEFTIDVTKLLFIGTPTIGIQAISLTNPSAYLRRFVNGEEIFGSAFYPTKEGVYHFSIMGSDIEQFQINCSNVFAYVSFERIEAIRLYDLRLLYFRGITGLYLPKRLETLYNLRTIMIWTLLDPGFNIDQFLSALCVLYNYTEDMGGHRIEDVFFDFSTPGPYGSVAATYLLDNGVDVNTL